MFFRMPAYRRDARPNQPARKVRQTLTESDNSILVHGVTLLREARAGFDTNPVTPLASHRHHPLSAIALTLRRVFSSALASRSDNERSWPHSRSRSRRA
jgi:hypothetical protein